MFREAESVAAAMRVPLRIIVFRLSRMFECCRGSCSGGIQPCNFRKLRHCRSHRNVDWHPADRLVPEEGFEPPTKGL
jgi:hypothetical protein